MGGEIYLHSAGSGSNEPELEHFSAKSRGEQHLVCVPSHSRITSVEKNCVSSILELRMFPDKLDVEMCHSVSSVQCISKL